MSLTTALMLVLAIGDLALAAYVGGASFWLGVSLLGCGAYFGGRLARRWPHL